ncbi:UNVERIFIED_CONTAM: Transposon Ty3-I Gag-Pol polyprotein [Sesamum angustifolium]|uniref:Transposon Ty3-I Gag-Pol polyprotein n=1 Tax=Sesamum angustifolium TaxID=2727405 RepID=A0AAW2QAF9_9LAMI
MEELKLMYDLSSLSARQGGKKERGRVTATVTDSRDIVSDRDARFTGRFWTALFNMMGTELKFSTANHPQTDGQTERVNALVEDYLRHYVSASQRNWVDLLDVAQFSYNLHKSSATGMSPFELAYGQQPTTPHEISVQRTGGKCPAAYRYARSKQELLDEARIAWPKHSAE